MSEIDKVWIDECVPYPQTHWDRQLPVSLPPCPKCGLRLAEAMGYVCPRGGDCPVGIGGVA